MLGAIAGDFIGSVYEFAAPKHKDFPLFLRGQTVTDDSILTIAVAEWVMHDTDLVARFHEMVERYPGAGWGLGFHKWARLKRRAPYQSYGNGAAMRISAVGWAFDSEREVLDAAAAATAVTHDHPEGIKGAQATALAVFLARTTQDKALIRREISSRFAYDLARTVDSIRPKYSFDETCQRTVPQALVAFLDATDYEDAIRNAISLGGDADTLACIAGGIAHAYFGGIPAEIASAAENALQPPLRVVWEEFRARYRVPA